VLKRSNLIHTHTHKKEKKKEYTELNGRPLYDTLKVEYPFTAKNSIEEFDSMSTRVLVQNQNIQEHNCDVTRELLLSDHGTYHGLQYV